ncbi:hypothetical protein GCK72_003398 [Caenorhabditis remanei]|uniref:Tyrosine-protein phosphatase domain-containing protein n=1 Tax=Caenorhabditis remanei TaxID=31234 RepID=A0A6A5HWC5_CAERE|nr:hypothetical protein GCK72_003398 [Caenorhabditis remanei]KAF1771571.1 hypothetical protein GCK72_003398 [Caenorhabditis remanei]
MSMVTFVTIATCSNQIVYPLEALEKINESASIITETRSNRRFFRNAGDDPLTKSLEQLQMVSRITNAIYLQHGLITGSIPTNELISELFHLGSILPSDIHSIDATKVQGAITALKELPSKLQPATIIQNIEGSFVALKTILEVIEGMGDIREWKEEKTKFKAGIQKLADSGVEVTDVSNIKGAATSWVSMSAEMTTANPTQGKSLLELLAPKLEVINNASNTLNVANLYSSPTTPGLTPIVMADAGVVKYTDHATKALVSEKKAGVYLNYFKTIQNETKPVKDASQEVRLIRDLLKSRLAKHQSLNYTAGFPDGSIEIPVVHRDLKFAWIRQIVNTDSLAVALSELKTLEPSTSKIEGILVSKEVVDSARTMFTFIEELETVESRSREFQAEMVGTYACTEKRPSNPDQPDFAEVQVLLDYLKKVDEMIAELKNKTELLKEYLKNPEIGEWCAEVIEICKEAGTNPNIQEIVNKFKDYGHRESLTKHMENIQSLAQEVVNVQKVTTIQNVSKDAVAKFNDLDAYHNSVGHYAEYFDCLQKKDLDRVFEMVESLKGIRSRHGDQKFADSMDSGMKTVNALNGLAGSFKEMENAMVAQKGFRSKETGALGLLKNGQQHSMTIGRAVEGVWNMKKALDRRSEVKLDIGVIQKYRSVLVNDSGDLKNLDLLEKIPKEILEMYGHLDKFQKTVQFSNDTILANHSSIFENAKMVTGLTDFDTSSLMSTLGKLKQHVKDSEDVKKLEKVEADLKLLESLGLNFASGYKKSFEESENTLKALDSFFLSYAKQMSATPAPPKLVTKPTASNQKGKMPEVVTVTVEKKVESDESMPLYFWLLIGIAIVITVVGCFFGAKKCWKCMTTIEPVGWYLDFSFKTLKSFLRTLNQAFVAYRSRNRSDYSNLETFYGYFEETCAIDTAACYPFRDTELVDMRRQCRFNTPLPKISYIELYGYGETGDRLHQSFLQLPNQRQCKITQGPMRSAERRIETRSKFWWSVRQSDANEIVQLCPWINSNGEVQAESYFPEEEGQVMEIRNKNIRLQCIKKTIYERDSDLEIRTIRVVMPNRKKPRRNDVFDVTHYFYKGWRDDDDVPSNVDTILHIIYMLEKKEKKVIVKNTLMVVCGNGVARSGPFTFIMHAIQSMKMREEPSLQSTMKAIHQARPYPISNGRLYGFCVYAIAKYVNEYCKGEEDSFDWEEEAIYNDLVAGYNGWREGRDAVANRGQH